MSEPISQWGANPEQKRPKKSAKGMPSVSLGHPKGEMGHVKASAEELYRETDVSIWFNPDLFKHRSTAKLDDQQPATLYYLGKLIKIDELVQVYVDQKPNGEIKHWAVIESRDVEVMDQIYDIELDTREKFPYGDLNFRVTVYTEDGPSAADQTMKIYDTR
mgnify:CR=1 FL=1